jgi:hypothetical protein
MHAILKCSNRKERKERKGKMGIRSDVLLQQYLGSLFAFFALFAVKSTSRERESL